MIDLSFNDRYKSEKEKLSNFKVQSNRKENYDDPTQIIWDSLLSLIDPIECLIELRKISQNEILYISHPQASFLTSLYSENYSEYSPELRIQTSLLLSSLFSNNISLVSIFDQYGLFSLVYPLFPHFKIPSFLHYYAERSSQCAEYLIKNGFISEIISLLSLSLDKGSDIDNSENEDNFLDYILCAGSICDFSKYGEQLLPLCSVFTTIITNETDWKIQCETINSLSILLKNVEIAAKTFLLNGSFLNDLISPERCESNLYYLTSVINLIGSLLVYSKLLDEELLQKFLLIFSTSLISFKDKCDNDNSFEACIKLIANALTDGCSDDNPDFPQQCLDSGIIPALFEIFYGENSWNLKIHVFEAILTLFSDSFPNIDSYKAFVDLGLFDLISNNLSEMCSCNGYAITSAINSLIMFLKEMESDENHDLLGFLLSEGIQEAIDMLLQSDDVEIKNNAEKTNLLIDSLHNGQSE